MERPSADANAPEAPRPSAARLVMIGIYVVVGLGMLAWPTAAPLLPTQEPLVVTGPNRTLAYLFGVYLCAKALALFLKYRQDRRPRRYPRSYVEVEDLFPPTHKPTDGPGKTDG